MTVREINSDIKKGKRVYIGYTRIRIMQAATKKGVLMGKALSSGNWIPINRIMITG